jgi:hypothetical protein
MESRYMESNAYSHWSNAYEPCMASQLAFDRDCDLAFGASAALAHLLALLLALASDRNSNYFFDLAWPSVLASYLQWVNSIWASH